MFSDTALAAARTLNERGIDGTFVAAFIIPTRTIRLSEDLTEAVVVPYSEIDGFPDASISGEAARVVAGRLSGRKILIFEGRPHTYESGNEAEMRIVFETIAALNIQIAVLTGFAASLNADWGRGGLAIIRDHINLTGRNPLATDRTRERAVSMVNAYDSSLRRLFKLAAQECGVSLNEGVLMWFPGPSFETPAEVKMAKLLGADLASMSIAPEAILARRFNLQVAALAGISNLGAGLGGKSSTHGESSEAMLAGAVLIRRVIGTMLKAL